MKKKRCLLSLPCSAISISLRPNSACLMFLTQKSLLPLEFFCCLSLGDVSSSELSVYEAAEMIDKKRQGNKWLPLKFYTMERTEASVVIQHHTDVHLNDRHLNGTMELAQPPPKESAIHRSERGS